MHTTIPYKQDIHRKKPLFHQQLISLQTLLVNDDNEIVNIFTAYPYQCYLFYNQPVLTDFSHILNTIAAKFGVECWFMEEGFTCLGGCFVCFFFLKRKPTVQQNIAFFSLLLFVSPTYFLQM